jgi:hypothetical protein
LEKSSQPDGFATREVDVMPSYCEFVRLSMINRWHRLSNLMSGLSKDVHQASVSVESINASGLGAHRQD